MSTKATAPSGCRVQVSVRVRPLGLGDGNRAKVIVHSDEDEPRMVLVEEGGSNKRWRRYMFDHVFFSGQKGVYESIGLPMLEETYNGFNVCLFAYGQTGSGKTYSLLGSMSDEEELGIIPRFVRDMFEEAQKRVEEDSGATIKFTVSMVEIYMEKVRDLLAARTKGQEPEALDILEDAQHRVFVRGAGQHPVLSVERMMALLVTGNRNRQTAETKMNETSSRSHAIFQITVSQTYESVEKKDLESVVTFVDLAGSERQTKTDSVGMQLEEAKKINHSLLMLGRALNSFSDRKGGDAYISLRESKLTRLLSESFGGNSKTWMLATVSPSSYNVTETLSTLDYARNAMAITNMARINKTTKIKELRDLEKAVHQLEGIAEGKVNELEQKLREVSALMKEIESLENGVDTLVDRTVEKDLCEAVVEQEFLCRRLYEKIVSGGNSNNELCTPLCLNSHCSIQLSGAHINSLDVCTLVIPCYTLVGPPPLLVCRVSVDEGEERQLVVSVWIVEVLYLPEFVTGGVQVEFWSSQSPQDKACTPVALSSGGDVQLNFFQRFSVDCGKHGTALRTIESTALHFQILGFCGH